MVPTTLFAVAYFPRFYSDQVTVVNPPFLKLMHKYQPNGLISTLAQEVFADIKVREGTRRRKDVK